MRCMIYYMTCMIYFVIHKTFKMSSFRSYLSDSALSFTFSKELNDNCIPNLIDNGTK